MKIPPKSRLLLGNDFVFFEERPKRVDLRSHISNRYCLLTLPLLKERRYGTFLSTRRGWDDPLSFSPYRGSYGR